MEQNSAEVTTMLFVYQKTPHGSAIYMSCCNTSALCLHGNALLLLLLLWTLLEVVCVHCCTKHVAYRMV